jgi:hypothetical protein
MPITGKFEADFSSFHSETQRAERALQSFEGSATKAGASVSRITDAAGGRTTRALGELSAGLGQVDRTLAAFGVNVGPQLAALREMEGLAMAAATGMSGILGPAILAVGGILIAWNTDWQKVHQTIADTTARLLGWGDRVGEMKAAAQENAAAQKRMAEETRLAAEEEKKAAAEIDAARRKSQQFFDDHFKQRQEARTKERKEQEAEAKATLEREKANQDGIWQLHYDRHQLDLKLMEEEVAAHKKATEAKIAAEQAWWATVHQGMLITGAPLEPGMGELERPQSLLRPQPLNQRGVVLPGSTVPIIPSAAPLSLGSGAPMRFGWTGQGGIVNIDARGALLNDPASQQRLYDIFNQATSGRMRSIGAKF